MSNFLVPYFFGEFQNLCARECRKKEEKNGIRELDSGVGAGAGSRRGLDDIEEEATSISGRRMCPKCIMAQPKSATPIAPTTKQREPKKKNKKKAQSGVSRGHVACP